MTLEEVAGFLLDEDARLRELIRLYVGKDEVQDIILALAGHLVRHHATLQAGPRLRGIVLCVLDALLSERASKEN